MFFKKEGSEYISSLISEAVKNGKNKATVSGCLEIDRAIRIPSDFTLILDNCHLRMADGAFDNMFVNEHHGTDIGKTPNGTDRNITILGKGTVILDGGKYNGLSEKNSCTNGFPHISKNNLLLFTNVNGFTIKNISCYNQRWWALNFIYCSNGHLSDIDFKACDIGIDENGNEYHGLKRDKYREVLVKNADGIDLRQGCHDIVIENISGFTEDDTIALTNLNGRIEEMYRVETFSSDICNILIKNIKASSFCTIVRLLNQGAPKIHHITIDDIYDTSAQCPYLDYGKFAVRVGDAEHMYGGRNSTAEETYNISIKNVYGRGQAVLHLAGNIGNLTYENIRSADGVPLIEDRRSC